MNKIIENWHNGLIVSCQAPANSLLAKPEIIAAFAAAAEQNGALGVRIDSPEHIRAIKQAVKVPILGIYKVITDQSDVYITLTFESARAIAEADTDVIALDATSRARLNGETLEFIAGQIRKQLNKLLMADVATFDEGLHAAEKIGVDRYQYNIISYLRKSALICGLFMLLFCPIT